MANFIDFVVEVAKNKTVGKEFHKMVQKSTAKELSEWFKAKGFTITEEESRKLIENKDSIKSSGNVKSY